MSVFEGRESDNPVEVLRTEALDAVVTELRAQPGMYEKAWDGWSVMALFEGTRLMEFRSIGHLERGRPWEMMLSRRSVRRPFERLCVVMEGPGGMLPTAMLLRYRNSDAKLVLDLAYDEAGAARWDLEIRGMDALAAEIDPLTTI